MVGNDYVMVLGGLGYIGSHTTLELLKEGYNVLVVDDMSNAFESAFTNVTNLAKDFCKVNGRSMPDVRLFRFDYQSPKMRQLLTEYSLTSTDSSDPPRSRITGIIHFAAFKSVSESIEKPLAYYRNNIAGLINLLDTLNDFGIKNFVFSSSATVYGEKSNAGKPLLEQDLVHFPTEVTDQDGNKATLIPGATGITSPYGRTKYFAEAILADVAKADPSMRITALRYFNPVGCHPSGLLREDPRQIPTNLFPVIQQVLMGQRPHLDVFGSDWDTRDGTAIRDFIHVVDLARGHTAALAAAHKRTDEQSFRAFNIGTGNGTTVDEVISSFEKATGRVLAVKRVGRRDGDVGMCVANASRAQAELGWEADIPMHQAAADAWRALNM